VFDHNPERAPLLQQSTSIINSDGDATSGNEMPYHVYSWYVTTVVSRVTGVLHCTIRSLPGHLCGVLGAYHVP
jgi:hypothetical protein